MEAAPVPVKLLHWMLSILPVVALLVFLVPLRWLAPEAGPMAMFTVAIVTLIAFRTPWETLAVAGGKGVWDAIFILYVIWPALLLYHVMNQAWAYDALRLGISRVSRNDLFIILAFSWVFASFLQGIAVGVTPIYAVDRPSYFLPGLQSSYCFLAGTIDASRGGLKLALTVRRRS